MNTKNNSEANNSFQPTGDKPGLVFYLGVISPAAESPRYGHNK